MLYLFENAEALSCVVPQAAAAGAINGTAIDTQGFGDAMVVVQVGATTGTPTSFTVNAKIQESADGSTGWVDVTGDTIAAVIAANKTAEINVALRSRVAALRYFRVVLTPAFVAGTSPTIGVSALALLGAADKASKVVNSATGN